MFIPQRSLCRIYHMPPSSPNSLSNTTNLPSINTASQQLLLARLFLLMVLPSRRRCYITTMNLHHDYRDAVHVKASARRTPSTYMMILSTSCTMWVRQRYVVVGSWSSAIAEYWETNLCFSELELELEDQVESRWAIDFLSRPLKFGPVFTR